MCARIALSLSVAGTLVFIAVCDPILQFFYVPLVSGSHFGVCLA